MKCLIEWDPKPKYRKDITKAWEKYHQNEKVKTIFPIHLCVGSNRGVAIVETDSAEALQETLEVFNDSVNFVVTPIIPYHRPK